MQRILDLGSARENLGNPVASAPIAAQLIMARGQPPGIQRAGGSLGQIDEQGAFKVSAAVGEGCMMRVAPGQPATLETGGGHNAMEVSPVHPHVRERRFQNAIASG